MSGIDLHAHTTCSDGTFTPAELVRLALDRGLDVLAVTDHDTTEGLDEAGALPASRVTAPKNDINGILAGAPVGVRLMRDGMAPPDPLHLSGHCALSARS